MPDPIQPDPEIEAEIKQIQTLGIEALRKRWCAMFGAPPPKALSKHITARMIAYRIQEEAFGGLDRDTIKSLERLAQGKAPSELNRRLKIGTVLIREYEGKRYTVTVAADGFLWEGQTYSSLGVPWTSPVTVATKGILGLPSTNTQPASRDREALAAIAKARIWIEEMCAGRTSSFAEIAKREGKCERHIRLLAPLAFMAPFLVTDLLKGSAPANGVTKAARKLSFSWSLQQL
jgi:hypothetical protein